MEAMLNFIPAPIAIALMLLGFVALAVGGIRLGYKATVKDLALELVISIHALREEGDQTAGLFQQSADRNQLR